MKIIDKYIEANIRLLNYSREDEFAFSCPQALSSTQDTLSFSILIDIKQTGEIPTKSAEVVLVHIFLPEDKKNEEGKNVRSQRYRTISLGKIALSDFKNNPSVETIDPNDPLLISDPWKIRQTVKWNFQNVRCDGPGQYAVAVSAYVNKKDAEQGKRTFLDCYYFEVV